MRIICATNMPYAEDAFGTLGDVTVLEGRGITADAVRDADLLAIRSTTRVNRRLLEGSRVRFVGTATIGTDHMDLDYLRDAGIAWCCAPGCNANSVSEYFVSALLCLAQRHGFAVEGLTVGVVGVGHVGSQVCRKAEALGIRVLKNDPPRTRAEGASGRGNVEVRGAGGHVLEPGPFAPLETVLAESDIITLHVPLTREGADRTVHMADRRFFARATRARVFVNAARGPVVDSDALLAALAPPLPRPAQQGEGRGEGAFRRVVLDTWEGEPAYRTDLMRAVDLATPHIAGHSFEGKVMGTLMVYREACRFLGVAPEWTPEGRLPPPPVPRLEARAAGRPDEDVLWEIVQAVYDIREDDRRFRETAVPDAARRAREFDRLRREYPERREFPFTEVTLRGASPRLAEKVRGLGFRVKAV